ncbi:MAG: hypothetical protein MUC48_27295 [Leptolyngbya sp. Prado105]|jgi:nitric oxide reductase subunit B|nr:hypothetical protein [Leptolyngbya sp. Prado105]
MTSPSIPVSSPQSAKRKRSLSLPAWLVLICVVSFSILLGAGAAIQKNAPPIPTTIVSPQQEVLITQAQIQSGQETYLARGGQHIGSVWGHGSYLAPDWSADFLHKWGLATAGVLQNGNPDFDQADLEALSVGDRASLQARVSEQFKINRYSPETQVLTLTTAQVKALPQVFADYQKLLTQGSRVHSIPSGWFTSNEQVRDVTSFFAWTAWQLLRIGLMHPFPTLQIFRMIP